MSSEKQAAEATRLESLWAGEFGDSYVDRNAEAGAPRETFWNDLLTRFPVASALEVGCNLGGNLQWLAKRLPAESVYGVDINQRALETLRQRVPGVNALFAPAKRLPFRDCLCDLTFTMGVLIHQPDATLPLVMSELVRCSKKYILCAEYFSEETVEVPYRGHRGALLKRNYLKLYNELFPELRVVADGFLGRDSGFDDVTWWLFERP